MDNGNARSKFNVDKGLVKRTLDGIVFDSELEMRYYRDVILPGIGSGSIVECKLQEPYILQPKFTHEGKTVLPIKYVADFDVTYADGREEVIDVKGMADTTAKLKRKLFWYVFPDLPYRWVSYSAKDGGWVDYDDLQRLRRERKKLKS